MKQKKIDELLKRVGMPAFLITGESLCFTPEDIDSVSKEIKQLIEQTLLVKKGLADRFYEPTQEELDRVKYQNELIEEQLKIWERL